jgi:urea transport system substrate-binding protein
MDRAVGTADQGGRAPLLSGTLAESGNSVADATRLAIEEINLADGLGRPIEAVVRDGEADWPLFRRGRAAYHRGSRLRHLRLLDVREPQRGRSDRREARPPAALPVQYEGLEMSPNVLYCGA